MENIKITIKDFDISLQKITHSKWEMEVYHETLKKTRTYSIEGVIYEMDSIENRLILYLEDKKYLYFTFENDCIIGDIYDFHDEYIDSFAAFDFNE